LPNLRLIGLGVAPLTLLVMRVLTGKFHNLPCDLWDGNMRLGGELFEGGIPIPLDYDGNVELNLEQDGKIRIVGTQARLELIGEARYIEEFPGNR
jgi:hypothetical protein